MLETTRHPSYAVSGAGAQAHQRGVWLEQGDRRLSQDPPLWPRPRQLDVHIDDHCLQLRPPAPADGRRGVTTPGSAQRSFSRLGAGKVGRGLISGAPRDDDGRITAAVEKIFDGHFRERRPGASSNRMVIAFDRRVAPGGARHVRPLSARASTGRMSNFAAAFSRPICRTTRSIQRRPQLEDLPTGLPSMLATSHARPTRPKV
jgi:hypothetical protein